MVYKRLLFFVFLSLAFFLNGCQSTSDHSYDLSISKREEKVIEDYLSVNLINPAFGGEIFTAFEILDTDKKNGKIFLWAFINEYIKKGEVIKEGSGMSVPLVLHVSKDHEPLKVLSHLIPRDGSYYSEDIIKLFPENILDKIINDRSTHIIKLNTEMEKKVKEYYQ